jgi:hypothetical protein
MASPKLSRRVRKVVSYPPLSELGDLQRREFHEPLLEAGATWLIDARGCSFTVASC